MERAMTPLARRALVFGAAAVVSVGYVTAVSGVDALPDARFVGYAQQVNDFEIAAARLALAKSSNENVRGFANRMIPQHTESAERLRKARAEAGVSFAPDPAGPPNTTAVLQRLGLLEGADFDTAYANAQLAVFTNAELQYGAYSQNGSSGPLRRYAQVELPKMQAHLEYARRLAGGR
jgi:putative membrane protein